jgi:hypothetical protein
MPQASRALVQSLANSDLKLEFEATRRVQARLAEVRNRLAKELEQNPASWQPNRLAPVLDVYLKEFEKQSVGSLEVGQQLTRGSNNGRLLLAEAAGIPDNSNYWNWAPVLPINAISLSEALATERIQKVSQQVKQKILQQVQVGLAMGAPISQLQDDILGVGLRGLKGRDGVFRSASARAETIARTTSNELINRGAFMTYSQVANKVPELDLQKVWQTISDNRTSDVCIALANQVQNLNEPFSGAGWTGDLPPAHPNCRSRISVLSKPYAKEFESRWSTSPQPNSQLPPMPTKVEKPEPTPSVQLSTNTLLSSDSSITQDALQTAIEGLPKEQSEAILKFLKQTDVQLVFTQDDLTEDQLYQMFSNLKFQGKFGSEIRGMLSRFFGNKVGPNGIAANGYTWVYSNHLSVRVAKPGVGLVVDQGMIKKQTLGVLRTASAKPDNLVHSFSYQFPIGTPEQMFSTTLHELGHQMQYKAGLDETPPPIGVKWFTNYGNPTVDQREWHAEAFRLWATNPDDYKAADPVGFEYMDNLVKKASTSPSFEHIPTNYRYGTHLANKP